MRRTLPFQASPESVAVHTTILRKHKILCCRIFLSLVDKQVLRTNRFSKLFSRDTLKVSFSCAPSVKRDINWEPNTCERDKMYK